jgi:hypothetical protein
MGIIPCEGKLPRQARESNPGPHEVRSPEHQATRLVEVKQVPFATLYTWPPDDGLQMGPKHAEAW